MDRIASRKRARGRLVAALAAAHLAAAAPAAAQQGSQQDPCARESWILAGAASQPDDGRAVFVPEWTPTLEAVVSCLRTEALADACVVVRGLTDERDFSPTLARAFGSPEAVQLARGQGRALAVQERLEAMGAPSHRLRIAAAVIGAKARGAELRLVRRCIEIAPRDRLGRAELEALVDERVTKALATVDATAKPAVPAADPAPLPALAVGEPPRLAPQWLDASLDLALLGFEPDGVFAPVLSIGAGLERRGFVARGGVGLAIGSAREERIGLEASASAGRRLARGVELCGEVRYRIASMSASAPWLDQVVGAGVRGTFCPGREGLVCLSASVLPLGVRWRQGEVSGGEAVTTPRTTDYAATIAVGAAFRWSGVR